MKNIHILPTDKPSRLYYNGTSYKDANSTIAMDWYISSAGYKPYNIYITSDEEIKEGDWFMTNLNEILKCTKKEDKFVWYERLTVPGVSKIAQPFSIHINLKPKKIILTTDQDLIKDGVQDIDDEFLEWFVKNPSCEYIELTCSGRNCIEEYGCTKEVCNGVKPLKIIIPKEEPKQETLEQAAERLYPFAFSGIGNAENDKKNHFIAGAKWQQQRMYSEEDLKEAFKSCYTPFSFDRIGDLDQDFNIWFEQFKKNK